MKKTDVVEFEGWTKEKAELAMLLIKFHVYGFFVKESPKTFYSDQAVATFDWIMKRTDGFKIPLQIDFGPGTTALGWYIVKTLDFRLRLGNILYDHSQTGIDIPQFCFGSGQYHGEEAPYMFVSDLFQKRGKFGDSQEERDKVHKIVFIGEAKPPIEEIVMIRDVIGNQNK